MTAHAPEQNEKLLRIMTEEIRNHVDNDGSGVGATSLAIDILRAMAIAGFVISEETTQ